jgi:predicted RND superfamily exporter protein
MRVQLRILVQLYLSVFSFIKTGAENLSVWTKICGSFPVTDSVIPAYQNISKRFKSSSNTVHAISCVLGRWILLRCLTL